MARGKKKGRWSEITSSKKEDDFNDEEVNKDHEDYFYDEIDKFHANKEKILLEDNDADPDNLDDGMEEVLAIESDESDTGDSNDSDDDQTSKDDKTDGAWGKKRSTFYGADTLEGLEGSDREEAEREEEEEVLAIQQRLAQQIDEDDIGLELLQGVDAAKETEGDDLDSHVTADFSRLSKKARWKIIKKDSPELMDLVRDFQAKLAELQTEILPMMKLVKKGKIPEGRGTEYIQLKRRVYLAYLLNISFYLALKAKKTSILNHPVISRLVQYRTVINQLVPIDKRLRPQIEELLHDNREELEEDEELSDKMEDSMSEEDGDQEIKDQTQKQFQEDIDSNDVAASAEDKHAKRVVAYFKSLNEKIQEKKVDAAEEKPEVEVEVEEIDDRRAIDYTIYKNKGLGPKKRKIDRNPRVKMRQKFKRAKIRRRGQVREYKPELKKYSGEASGIRAGLKKSITLQ